jgi:hypothetical protein
MSRTGLAFPFNRADLVYRIRLDAFLFRRDWEPDTSGGGQGAVDVV